MNHRGEHVTAARAFDEAIRLGPGSDVDAACDLANVYGVHILNLQIYRSIRRADGPLEVSAA